MRKAFLLFRDSHYLSPWGKGGLRILGGTWFSGGTGGGISRQSFFCLEIKLGIQ